MVESKERLELGGLWRDVVNFLGDRPVEPSLYLPLLRHVLPKWRGWTGFLSHAADKLHYDLVELEADATRAELAWQIWTDRREPLRALVRKAAKRPVDDRELRDWWFSDERTDWAWRFMAKEAAPKLAKALSLTAEEEWLIEYHPEIPADRGKTVADLEHDWILHWLKSELVWVEELEALRALARKTWTAGAAERVRWTRDELTFLNNYYEEQLPSLYAPGDPEQVDPFDLDTQTWEQSLGFPLDGLRYCFEVLMRAAAVDFADEVLDRNRHPNNRGSLRCVECGRFVGRRALGYGQLYCTDRCKKRAAKRRYRSRARAIERPARTRERCAGAPSTTVENHRAVAAVA